MTEEETAKPDFRGPLYAQVAQVIRSEIALGRFGIGTILPSELDMAQTFNVSVGTMRKALAMLADDKMIRRSRGRGTEVIASQPPMRRSVFKYSPDLVTEDEEVVISEQPASSVIADQLGVATHDPIRVLVRTIAFDGKSRALRSRVFAGADLSKSSAC
ncbi:MAG: GntR family transcriptional regulator [Filomicrobium sp.]